MTNSSDTWLTVSQATYTSQLGSRVENQAALRRRRELQEALERRSHSPAFAAKSNAELSYLPPHQAKRVKSCKHADDAHGVRDIPFETSTSRLSFLPPQSSDLVAEFHTRLSKNNQGKSRSPSPTKFVANSENRRQFVEHDARQYHRVRPEERPLRSTPSRFEAHSTYQETYKPQ